MFLKEFVLTARSQLNITILPLGPWSLHFTSQLFLLYIIQICSRHFTTVNKAQMWSIIHLPRRKECIISIQLLITCYTQWHKIPGLAKSDLFLIQVWLNTIWSKNRLCQGCKDLFILFFHISKIRQERVKTDKL